MTEFEDKFYSILYVAVQNEAFSEGTERLTFRFYEVAAGEND
jgi:hypothetical protein